MRIIEPYFEVLDDINGDDILKRIELCGRVCYKSEDKITVDSAREFVRKLLINGHESVIEHEKISVRIICDRGVAHEIIRHRIASYSHESTRYCNYSKSRFGNELTFIKPIFWKIDSKEFAIWKKTMQQLEDTYMYLLRIGSQPQEARSVLPNSLKAELIVTMNIREWRHFFKLRTQEAAHPQMREIAFMILREFQLKIPILFDDINAQQSETL